ncbi:peptide chain release factor N(5)-glutamine methyltransferase [Caproiciproducens sp. CPB-2]|uniref:peptide chain release factor N(5)-glutamine methyltransferase n=1 Tax=Caproiciproducens sp. CPB-2 TaxID=3030017 RepID=UPI0023DB8760|nr:peptide chain release factor N(5)-glutamine methyltransferase [Caproiciproducens sp. CPB-2]MDF1493520.1 peptide chain release factor N(5)-glutamine methyltransferase [Caproiciproducens sp. CPB-2]
MTLGETYRMGKNILAGAGIESPAFDASCLFEKVFGLDRQRRIVHAAEPAEEQKTEEYLRLSRERAGGRPLQYILGSWPFLGLTLAVGEGVLIPREETELLVQTAAELLRGRENPEVLDLCSGSGAVALGLASLFPGASVLAAELYGEALSYLDLNIRNTGFRQVKSVQTDVLNPESAARFASFDCIVSNPPYVAAGELRTLQAEVRREPRTALLGGEDGLLFYRAIASLWLPKLKPGGAAAAEIGEGQAEPVARLFQNAGLSEIRVVKDFNGFDRVVAGIRKSN